MLTLEFILKIFAKIIKTFQIFQISNINLEDLYALKFWLKIYIPGEISDYLIGRIIYFYEKAKFSFSELPL